MKQQSINTLIFVPLYLMFYAYGVKCDEEILQLIGL